MADTSEDAAREWLEGYRGLDETFRVRDDHVSIALTIAEAAFLAGAKWGEGRGAAREREAAAQTAQDT